MEEVLNFDPTAVCRCCLVDSGALVTIFSKEIINGSILSFRSVFESVVGTKIQLDDGFPQKLCAPCRKTVVKLYVFQQTYKTNFKLLCSILNIEMLNDQPADFQQSSVRLDNETNNDAQSSNRVLSSSMSSFQQSYQTNLKSLSSIQNIENVNKTVDETTVRLADETNINPEKSTKIMSTSSIAELNEFDFTIVQTTIEANVDHDRHPIPNEIIRNTDSSNSMEVELLNLEFTTKQNATKVHMKIKSFSDKDSDKDSEIDDYTDYNRSEDEPSDNNTEDDDDDKGYTPVAKYKRITRVQVSGNEIETDQANVDKINKTRQPKPLRKYVHEVELTDEQIQSLGKIPKVLNKPYFRIVQCNGKMVRARCLTCGARYSGSDMSKTRFVNHLRKKHAETLYREYTTVKPPVPVELADDEQIQARGIPLLPTILAKRFYRITTRNDNDGLVYAQCQTCLKVFSSNEKKEWKSFINHLIDWHHLLYAEYKQLGLGVIKKKERVEYRKRSRPLSPQKAIMTDEEIRKLGRLPKIMDGEFFRIQHYINQKIHAKCNWCDSKCRTSIRGWSYLVKHLKMRHPLQYINYEMYKKPNCVIERSLDPSTGHILSVFSLKNEKTEK